MDLWGVFAAAEIILPDVRPLEEWKVFIVAANSAKERVHTKAKRLYSIRTL